MHTLPLNCTGCILWLNIKTHLASNILYDDDTSARPQTVVIVEVIHIQDKHLKTSDDLGPRQQEDLIKESLTPHWVEVHFLTTQRNLAVYIVVAAVAVAVVVVV